MGENRIKLVAADMDGTLLNRERKITKYTQNVIKKAMAQGVYFVPATGRAVNALPPELKEMEGILAEYPHFRCIGVNSLQLNYAGAYIYQVLKLPLVTQECYT